METEEYYGLENLLEVVVEEEDQELNVSNNADGDNFELPPVPTFDLQNTPFSNFSYIPTPLPPAPLLPQPKKVQAAPKVVKSGPVSNLKEVKQQLLSSFESTRMVLDKADKYPKDLTIQSADEMSFYHTVFKELSNVTVCRLHCTICDKHIGCGVSSFPKARAHRMLKVLICKECFDFYGDGKFPLDDSDNTEVYCRWCGQGGDLVCCSFCPKVFCYKCVKRNFDTVFLKQIEKADEWACFCCAQIPLWPLRAVCRALLSFLQCGAADDVSNCCKKVPIPTKPKRPVVPKLTAEKQVSNPMVVFQPGVMFPASSSQNNAGSKPYPLYKMTPPTVPQKQIAISPKPIPKPVRQVPAAPRTPIAPKPPVVPKPPVETLKSRAGRPIRSAALANAKPSPPALASKPVLPLNMPKVRIDHSTLDTTVVRLRLSNNKEQYLRVNVVGNCQRMPKFPPDPTITMTTLAHAFRANKMAHDKLKGLKDKLEGNKMGNIFEEATAIKAMLSKWQEVVSIIENDLAENMKIEEEKKKKSDVDIIELSDDEDEVLKPTWQFLNWNSFGGDSDIEIIDDPLPVPPVSEKRKRTDQSSQSSKKICLSNGEVGTAENDDGSKESSKDESNSDNRDHSGIKLVDDDAETETDEEMEKEEKTDDSSKPNAEKKDSETSGGQDKFVTEVSSSTLDAGNKNEATMDASDDVSSKIDANGDNSKSATKGDKSVVADADEDVSNSASEKEKSIAEGLEDAEPEEIPDSVTSVTVNEESITDDKTENSVENGRVVIENDEGTLTEEVHKKSDDGVAINDSSNIQDISGDLENPELDSTAVSDEGCEPTECTNVSESSKLDENALVDEQADKSEGNSVVDEESMEGVADVRTPDIASKDNEEISNDIPGGNEETERENEDLEGSIKSADASANDSLTAESANNSVENVSEKHDAQVLNESCENAESSAAAEGIESIENSKDGGPVSKMVDAESKSLNLEFKEQAVSDENFDDVLDDLCRNAKTGEDEKMEVDDDLEASLCTEDTSKDVGFDDIDEEALLNDG